MSSLGSFCSVSADVTSSDSVWLVGCKDGVTSAGFDGASDSACPFLSR